MTDSERPTWYERAFFLWRTQYFTFDNAALIAKSEIRDRENQQPSETPDDIHPTNT